MRKILMLALAAPLFAACAPEAPPAAGARVTGAMGDGRPTIERSGTFNNAGSGAAAVTGEMGDGRPTIERGPATGPGVGCPGGVTVTRVRDGRPVTECR